MTVSDKDLDQQTRTALQSASTATIANALLKRGLRNVYMLGLSPLCSDQPTMIGPAFTLRFIPAREDLDSIDNYSLTSNVHRRAIEECPAGSVLVIDAMGSLQASSAGDMMLERLLARHVQGIVTDGGFRDTPAMRAVGLPAYQQYSAPPATINALHPVELDVPVACAGVAVYPGDIIVGDAEGVVVIPRHCVEEVAQEAHATALYEEYAQQRIKQGESIFEVFPATEQSRQDYAKWQEHKRSGQED